MQRRRRRKAEPKNIFGSNSQQPTQKKSTNRRVINRKPVTRAPPVIPGVKREKITPILVEEDTSAIKPSGENQIAPNEDVSKTDIAESSTESLDLVEKQLLGTGKRKRFGLSKKDIEVKEEAPESVEKKTSDRARQLIESSLERAMQKEKQTQSNVVAVETKVEKTVKKKAPQRKFRGNKSSYQPANREKRLDRSRHMEYKYEMRALLSKLDVAEEFRSNILATVWARGERQTIVDAKEYLNEKLSEGKIDEKQQSSISKVVDRYTIRR